MPIPSQPEFTASRDAPAGNLPVTENALIRIMCPNLSCQRVLVVPEAARGKVVRCRMCGMNIRIPAAKGTDAPAKQGDGATTESA